MLGLLVLWHLTVNFGSLVEVSEDQQLNANFFACMIMSWWHHAGYGIIMICHDHIMHGVSFLSMSWCNISGVRASLGGLRGSCREMCIRSCSCLTPYTSTSLVPRPTPFFSVLRFVLTIIHGLLSTQTEEQKKWGTRLPIYHTHHHIASFPVPRPAFRCMQYGKAGRAGLLHLLTWAWHNQKIFRTKTLRFECYSTRSTLGEYDSRPLLARYVWYVTWYLRSSCCSETYAHASFRSFYPFLPLTSLMWKDVPGPPRFTVLQATKSWAWDWERG